MKKLSKWFKKYFIPHHHNDYKPHLLRYESTVALLLILVIVEILFLFQILFVFNKTNFLASVLPAVLTSLTNEQREENNLTPLVENTLLVKAAQMKAQDMASKGYFAHVTPDGKTPWYWLDQVGYRYSSAGENLAVNFFESRDVAQAWMNSPTHRANIVKANYKEIGIGIASGVYKGKDTIFVAQFFGTPTILNLKANSTLFQETKPITTPVAPTTPETKPVTPTPKLEPTTPITNRNAVAVASISTQVLGEESASPIQTQAIQDKSLFSNTKSFVEKVLSSPRSYANYILGGVLIVTILALLLSLFIRFEMVHHHSVARGAAIVAIVFMMMFINIKIFNTDIDLPVDNISASVINK
ncbi:MAG: CAP domain-containing protein [Patescibacteria group bacterium]